MHDGDTFCRMVIRSAGDGVLIDLAVNAPPDLPGVRDVGRADACPGRTRRSQTPRPIEGFLRSLAIRIAIRVTCILSLARLLAEVTSLTATIASTGF
jgi:hypothetical protein